MTQGVLLLCVYHFRVPFNNRDPTSYVPSRLVAFPKVVVLLRLGERERLVPLLATLGGVSTLLRSSVSTEETSCSGLALDGRGRRLLGRPVLGCNFNWAELVGRSIVW